MITYLIKKYIYFVLRQTNEYLIRLRPMLPIHMQKFIVGRNKLDLCITNLILVKHIFY